MSAEEEIPPCGCCLPSPRLTARQSNRSLIALFLVLNLALACDELYALAHFYWS